MLLALVVVTLLSYWLYHQLIGRRAAYPPGPTPWPLVGHAFNFGLNAGLISNGLTAIGKRYPLGMFTAWMPNPWVVITDYELMKEAMVTHGEAFSGRAVRFLFVQTAKGKYGIVGTDGPTWKEQRRFGLHVLRDFGFGKGIMEDKIQCDVDRLVEHLNVEIDKADGEATIDPADCLVATVSSIISNLVFSRRYQIKDDPRLTRLLKVQKEFFESFVDPMIQLVDLFPWLRHVPLFDNFHFKHFMAITDQFWEIFINELEEQKQREVEHPDEEPENYTAAFLKEMRRRKEKGEPVGSFSDWQLVTAAGDLYFAGMETTVTTLRWAMRVMTILPEALKERGYFCKDRPNTPYVTSIIHELQRISNILPINLLHRTTRDVELRGQTIPADTWILPHISAVLKSEEHFPEPDAFRPERFLNKDGKVNQELADTVVAFGMGKRQCMGESLARMELYLIFTTLIQKFKFSRVQADEGKDYKTLMKPKVYFTHAPWPYEITVRHR